MTEATSSFCATRRFNMQYSMPPTRIELQNSPYPQYSQEQLNMRRKAEILKYASNAQNTQTNNLTKSQKWSQIIAGRRQASSYPAIIGLTKTYNPITGRNTFSQYVDKITTVDCTLDDSIATPTSSCDVPGKIVYFVRDNAVPLYNYSTNTDSYGFLQSITSLSKWYYFVEPDITINSGVETTLLMLSMNNAMDEPFHTYNINIPIGFSFYGTDISSTPFTSIYYPNNTLILPSDLSTIIKMHIYYNNELMTLSTQSTVSFTPATEQNIVFDISFSPMQTTDNYFGTLYYGLLNLNIVDLPTRPGYTYEIRLAFDLPAISETNIDNSIIQFNTFNVICNLSQEKTYQTKNCKFTSPNISPASAYSSFSIS